jgi:mono/diheme cytochrome c family protein
VGSISGERKARVATRAALALGLAATAAGCGSGTVAPLSGRAVFATHCDACHSLSGSALPRQQGGDLKNVHLPHSDLVQLTAEMPPLHGPLTARELRAVVTYVESVERH